MKKRELVSSVAEDTGISKSNVDLVLESAFNIIAKELGDGGSVNVPKFGTFSVTRRSSRPYYDVHRGTKGMTQECNAVKFTASQVLKDFVQ